MSAEFGKQYGLILQKKGTSQNLIQRPSVFNDDSESECSNHDGGDWRAAAFKTEAVKTVEKRSTKIQIQKALSEDPSIYQYDEVYDGLKDNTNKIISKSGDKKQSRYIQSLKKNAERRKLENERRTERQVQKEREEEGEQFKNKETFVTASYKKKLQEFQKLEEEEIRMDHLEEIGDVTKQKDLSGFYRHLYKSTVLESPKTNQNLEMKKESDSKEILHTKSASQKGDMKPVQIKKRQYRKRTKSSSSKEEGEKTSSTSSSSDSESGDNQTNKIVKSDSTERKRTTFAEHEESRFIGKDSIEDVNDSTECSKEVENIKLDVCFTYDSEELKGKTIKESVSNTTFLKPEPFSNNIWLKRTIGANFDEALQRYLERKSKKQIF